MLISDEPGKWQERIRGFQPNASCRSHSELVLRTSLDAGDPVEFGKQVAELKRKMPWVNILGGCCGTYLEHIESICKNVCSKQ
jgi:homocysteine S-methyltransferase